VPLPAVTISGHSQFLFRICFVVEFTNTVSTETVEPPRWQGARLRRTPRYGAMERNAASGDGSAVECHRICEFDHLGSVRKWGEAIAGLAKQLWRSSTHPRPTQHCAALPESPRRAAVLPIRATNSPASDDAHRPGASVMAGDLSSMSRLRRIARCAFHHRIHSVRAASAPGGDLRDTLAGGTQVDAAATRKMPAYAIGMMEAGGTCRLAE
jgi:hypothetical protein